MVCIEEEPAREDDVGSFRVVDGSTIECEVEVGVSVITCEEVECVVSRVEVVGVVMGVSEEDELSISGSSSNE